MTNAVAVSHEFIDERCGIVALVEDAGKMAQGITALRHLSLSQPSSDNKLLACPQIFSPAYYLWSWHLSFIDR